MRSDFQWVATNVLYRYSRNVGPEVPVIDGYSNFKYAFRPRRSGQSSLQLERGINASREVESPDGPRRPVIMLRSSPAKSGTANTPWRDEFNFESQTVRYFGDSKPGASAGSSAAAGNRTLTALASRFYSRSRDDRQLAPPIALFRGESAKVEGQGILHKGFVRFIGLGVLEKHETIQQSDNAGTSFSNLLFTIRLCRLDDTGGRVNWSWINDRRDPAVPTAVANLRAPFDWRHWVETGSLPN